MGVRAPFLTEPGVAHVLPRPLTRALDWAIVFFILSALLPTHLLRGEPAYMWADGSSDGLVTLATHALVIVVLVVLRRARISQLLQVVVAVTTAVMFVAAEPSLLPFLPPPLDVNARFTFGVVAASAIAALWSTRAAGPQRPRWPALAMCGVAFLFCGLSLFYPHRIGTLFDHLLAAGSILLTPGVDERISGASLTKVLLGLLPVVLASVALKFSLDRRRTEAAAVAWIITLPVASSLVLSLKVASRAGSLELFLYGLRGGLIFAALAMVIVFSVSALLARLYDETHVPNAEEPPLLREELLLRVVERAIGTGSPDIASVTYGYRADLRRMVDAQLRVLLEEFPQKTATLGRLEAIRRYLIEDRGIGDRPPGGLIHFLGKRRHAEWAGAVFAIVIASAVLVPSSARVTQNSSRWNLSRGASWVEALYEEHLPALAVAAGTSDPTLRKMAIALAAKHAQRAAAPIPELARAIDRLAGHLDDGLHGVDRSGVAINRIARAHGLPYYLDVEVAQREGRPIFLLRAYRIERSRTARMDNRAESILWSVRADRLNIGDGGLGFTKLDAGHGIVVLDVVRGYFESELAPALSDLGAFSWSAPFYARRELLIRELAAGIERTHPDKRNAERELRALIACLSHAHELDARHRRQCSRIEDDIEPYVIEVLARKVERHEAQHAMDRDELVAPHALLEAMPAYDAESITLSTGELSAYLAEIAYSEQPRLALLHFLSLAQQRPGSPEAMARAVGVPAMLRGLESVEDLAWLPEAEIRKRAEEAYQEVFGQPPPKILFDEDEDSRVRA